MVIRFPHNSEFMPVGFNFCSFFLCDFNVTLVVSLLPDIIDNA